MQKYVIALYIRLSIEDYKYDSLSTVSYTHLDVYKRQPESTGLYGDDAESEL